MRVVGQLALLTAFVTAGYGAFAAIAGSCVDRVDLRRQGQWLAWITVALLSAVIAILAHALVVKDFSFDYVAQSSSRLLPWHYSLSSLWVGQAGSLLLWAWILAILTLLFHAQTRAGSGTVRSTTLGILLGCVDFLLAILVIAADPMKASVLERHEGAGLSPLLQHPAMLIHPPVVFAGYAAWAVPFAILIAALAHRATDSYWLKLASNWSLAAWTVLGGGILLGAHWAYQELGWGGYWAWDPVENGSLVPWLTGTALVHSLMAWRYRQALPRTAAALAVCTFALCNWATFLTRSGIFSSVHAFSQSPIGWMFLLEMLGLVAVGAIVGWCRRDVFRASRPLRSVLARESLILISVILLSLLTVVIIVGTLIAPLSTMWAGRTIQFGPDFYNRVLAPIGLALLTLTAMVPLVRWGRAPRRLQLRLLAIAGLAAVVGTCVAGALGVRSLTGLGVSGLAAFAGATLVLSILLDGRLLDPRLSGATAKGRQLLLTLRHHRRRYAAYAIHLGFVALAVGVTGSSLGTREFQTEIAEGESIEWAGWTVRHVELVQRDAPDKLVAEARLEVTGHGRRAAPLIPARHWHRLQKEWTSEVAIHSTWRGDLYVILHAGLGEGRILVTLVENPLIAWLWWGGCLSIVGAFVALWPSRRSAAARGEEADPEMSGPAHVTAVSVAAATRRARAA